MLVPTSRRKVDWAKPGRKSKCKSYKARQPVQLVPDAAKHLAAALTAESVQQVEEALEELQIYDRAQHVFPKFSHAGDLRPKHLMTGVAFCTERQCVSFGSFTRCPSLRLPTAMCT